MKEIVKSYAKINLGLHVVKKTRKNYHKLQMIMTEIDLYDEIIFEENNDIIVIMDNDICSMENNLCYKVANYLKDRYNVRTGIKITINKNIPDGGGLGGGSSNAAVVLKYLNKMWNLNLRKKHLMKIGYKFGCDIPFFIEGGIKKVEGYGERLKTLKIKPIHDEILLIVPDFKNSTSEVFGNHCVFCKNRIKKLLKALKQRDYYNFIFNDLEEAANKVSDNKIYSIKKKLIDIGVIHNVMSGSGSTIVCFFSRNEDILVYQNKLKNEFGNYKIIKSKLKMYSY